MGVYKPLEDGEWADVPKGFVKVACCDCALVHVLQIQKRRRGGFRYRAWRDERATAAKRRRKAATA